LDKNRFNGRPVHVPAIWDINMPNDSSDKKFGQMTDAERLKVFESLRPRIRESLGPLTYFQKKVIGSVKLEDVEDYFMAEHGLSYEEAGSLIIPQIIYLLEIRHKLQRACIEHEKERILLDVACLRLQFAILPADDKRHCKAFVKALKTFPNPPGRIKDLLQRHGLLLEELMPGIRQDGLPKGHNDDRDRWVYEECCKGTAHLVIISNLKNKTGWVRISSVQGIRACARRYAQKFDLPEPPSRKNL